jgi:ribosome recycling factor
MEGKGSAASDILLEDAKNSMEKTLGVLSSELASVRTSRAHTGLIDHLKVNYYGSTLPLSQLTTLSIQDARTLIVEPWDKAILEALQKVIQSANLGVGVSSDGVKLRISIPELTHERRLEIVKYIRKLSEDSKVAIRNVRRHTLDKLKTLQKDKGIPEDEVHRIQEELQRLTDKHIGHVDEILARKEREILD